jgi:hypothetical protein
LGFGLVIERTRLAQETVPLGAVAALEINGCTTAATISGTAIAIKIIVPVETPDVFSRCSGNTEWNRLLKACPAFFRPQRTAGDQAADHAARLLVKLAFTQVSSNCG